MFSKKRRPRHATTENTENFSQNPLPHSDDHRTHRAHRAHRLQMETDENKILIVPTILYTSAWNIPYHISFHFTGGMAATILFTNPTRDQRHTASNAIGSQHHRVPLKSSCDN